MFKCIVSDTSAFNLSVENLITEKVYVSGTFLSLNNLTAVTFTLAKVQV